VRIEQVAAPVEHTEAAAQATDLRFCGIADVEAREQEEERAEIEMRGLRQRRGPALDVNADGTLGLPATAATAATATAAAAAAAAAATALALLRLVNAKRPAVVVAAVELFDGLGRGIGFHLDETEATGATGFPVRHDYCRLDVTVWRE